MKKISLGSWAFAFGPYAGDPVPFDRTAKRLADAGYDAIEVCGIQQHVTLEAYPTKESREPIRQMLDGLGLARSGYACDQYAADPTEAANKEKYLERFARNLEMCNDLGIANIRVDTVAPPNKYSNPVDREAAKGRVCEVFNAAAQKAQEAGIKMHWEFEPGFLFNKPGEIVEIHEKTAHANFTVMFDTSHAYMCAVVGARQPGAKETLPGGVEELLAKLEGRLHDNETSTHSPFGAGNVNFRSLAPKLLAVPDIDYWTIDMCFWAGSWELTDASLAYVRKLLQNAVTA
jgi:sugar phosphate isomerase/epimerase